METIWMTLTWACLIWYSTITVYVAYKGAYDIKHMLRDLNADHERKQAEKKPGS